MSTVTDWPAEGRLKGQNLISETKRNQEIHQDRTGSSAEKVRVNWELLCTCPRITKDSDGTVWRSGAGLGAESRAGPWPGSGWGNALFACKSLDTLWALICAETGLKWQLHTQTLFTALECTTHSPCCCLAADFGCVVCSAQSQSLVSEPCEIHMAPSPTTDTATDWNPLEQGTKHKYTHKYKCTCNSVTDTLVQTVSTTTIPSALQAYRFQADLSQARTCSAGRGKIPHTHIIRRSLAVCSDL